MNFENINRYSHRKPSERKRGQPKSQTYQIYQKLPFLYNSVVTSLPRQWNPAPENFPFGKTRFEIFFSQSILEMNRFPHLVLCVSLPLRKNWPRYRDATVAVCSCAPHTWRANDQILLALASNSGKTLVLACASCQRNKTTRAGKIMEEEGSKSRKKKYEKEVETEVASRSRRVVVGSS